MTILAVFWVLYLLVLVTSIFVGPLGFAAALSYTIVSPLCSFCLWRCTFDQCVDRIRRGLDNVLFYTAMWPVLLLMPVFLAITVFCMIGYRLWRAIVERPYIKYVSRRNIAVYSPWKLKSGEIRLLQILPGRPEEALHCKLVPGNLVTSTYEALSYTWGSIYRQRGVIINDHKFYVTANLYAALLRLRKAGDIRTIWVDAACINQSDLWERNSQVEQMKIIYQRASRVVIWLGNTQKPHLDQGMKYVVRLADMKAEDVHRVWQESSQWQVAVDALFRFDWWDRAWVIQEAVLGQTVVVQCGYNEIPFECLCSFITNPAITGRLPGLQRFAVFNLADTVQRMRAQQFNPKYGMLEFAHAFRHRRSTDPRDKLYAILGLVTHKKDLLISVDYTKSKDTLFLDFAKRWINRYGSLLPIALAPSNSTNCSSWCPSWAASGNASGDWFPWESFFNGMDWEHTHPFWRGGLDDLRWHPLQRPGKYLAAGGHPAVCQTDLADSRIISVKGFTYDRIVAVGDQAMWRLLTTWRKFLGRWEEIAFRHSDLSIDQKRKAFNRTLTANIWNDPTQDWRKWAPRSGNMWTTQVLSVGEPQDPSIQDILKAACGNRRFFVTSKGTFGLGSTDTRIGDLVCVLLGSDIPFILHRSLPAEWKYTSSEDRDLRIQFPVLHKVLGQAYVDGIMVYDGSIKQDIEDGKVQLEEFFLF